MIEEINLKNGVSILMEKMDSMRSVSFGIFVKNGSINENEQNNGISHFIEHMLFKGTKKRSSKDIAEEMDSIGGELNAYTSKEYTCFYLRTLDIHLDKAIDILFDMFFNSKFSDEDIEKESNVIIEEISMYEDSPEDVVFSKLQKEIWKNYSLSYPVLGTKENIKKFRQKDFIDYLKNNYIPENIVISVAGSFDKEELLKKIEKNFGNLKNNSYNKNILKNEKAIFNVAKLKTIKDIEQLHMCISFEGISLNSKYNYAISLLNTIFGGGISSILFQKVREEKGLAYTIYSYNNSYKENGVFNIYAGLNPIHYEKMVDIIEKEIILLKNKKISIQQINKTKEQLKSNYIMGLESTSNRMSGLGRSKLLLNKIKTPDEIIEEVDKIKKEDIDFLIDNIFNLDKKSISIVGNAKNIEKITL